MSSIEKTSKMWGPLNLTPIEADGSSTSKITKKVTCLKCDQSFLFPDGKNDCLAHLYLEHRVIISDVETISLLEEYLEFWRNKFTDIPLEEYCTTMMMNQLPDGQPSTNERYYLLSDVVPIDKALRIRLDAKQLESVLMQHQMERTDQTFVRGCLYCREVLQPTRAVFLEHLFEKHFLQLGKSENLVFVDELIAKVQSKLDNLVCLFCDKIFKDRVTLKEHMRKKGHKKINPDNKEFDKYFLINYKNNTETHQKAPRKHVHLKRDNRDKKKESNFTEKSRVFQTDDSDSDWSDWEGEKLPLICLYCTFSHTEFGQIKDHMKCVHHVNFDERVEILNFYQRVKVVNYIRRQMHLLKCVTCDQQFETSEVLCSHLEVEQHYGIGEKKSWDQPEFFFPTYEDDAFLCHLDELNLGDDVADDSGVIVLPEETTAKVNRSAEALSVESFSF